MKAVVQRVKKASVKVQGAEISAINKGVLVFLGVEKGDTLEKAKKLAKKIAQLRIFPSENKEIDLSLERINGEILVVSQFTLCADLSKGNRPSFVNAEDPEKAEKIYLEFINFLKQTGLPVKTGQFRTYMEVNLVNDGPVTIVLEI
ncbi:D-tyrosyl-tRNA(Tyr) deacylase [bacterium]|nr:D-tyrosyl-tRNA(Tyr) deacylase [bacterium]